MAVKCTNTYIGIILNPRARKVKKNPGKVYNRFMELVGDRGEVRITWNDDDLRLSLKDFQEKEYGVLGITGGDGSLHYILTMLRKEFPAYDPCILVLKGGTMDNVGRSKGIRGRDTAILSRYIRNVMNDIPLTVVEQSLLMVDGRYSFIFGTGFITKFLRKAYEKRKGYFQNMVVSIDAVMDFFRKKPDRRYFTKIRGSFIVDGKELPFKKCHGILGATVSSIAHGIDPLYKAKGREDFFHVLIVGQSTRWIFRHLLFILAGVTLSGKKHFDGIINRLEIISEKPFEYTLDGDIYPCSGKLLVEKGGSVKLVIV